MPPLPADHWIHRTGLDIEEHSTTTHDGLKLTYQTYGTGQPVLLCNGLGGSMLAWKHILTAFGDQYRFIAWDYRGLFRSEAPPTPEGYAMEHHVRDGLTVLEAASVSEPAFVVGWSMGVQVALETWHNASDRVKALVLVNGTYGHIFQTAFNLPYAELIARLVTHLAKLGHAPIEAGVRLFAERPLTMRLLKGSRFVHRHLDESVFFGLAKEFGHFNMRRYVTIMEHLSEHTAGPYLHRVDVPTLIVHGEYDLMTPLPVAQKMLNDIPQAELFTLPAGSHYCIIEFPEIVNLRLEKFLREVG